MQKGKDPSNPLISSPIEVTESSNSAIDDYYYTYLKESADGPRILFVGNRPKNGISEAGLWGSAFNWTSNFKYNWLGSRLLKVS